MAEIPVIVLPAPPWQYGDKTKMRKWLGLTREELDAHIEAGNIMVPKARKKADGSWSRPMWTQVEAIGEKIHLENLDRYKPPPPPKGEKTCKNPA